MNEGPPFSFFTGHANYVAGLEAQRRWNHSIILSTDYSVSKEISRDGMSRKAFRIFFEIDTSALFPLSLCDNWRNSSSGVLACSQSVTCATSSSSSLWELVKKKNQDSCQKCWIRISISPSCSKSHPGPVIMDIGSHPVSSKGILPTSTRKSLIQIGMITDLNISFVTSMIHSLGLD